MSLQSSPGIVRDGLVLYYDMNNPKSFTGSPTVNQIGLTDGYPTTGNGWSTYNTNNYNSGAFFSISAIVSVVGNLVTTTSAHGMRTYDAMRPQTSGGGLTANTDYFIKAWSTTTFSVHQYTYTQDGSLGFSALDPIDTDTRISINATSFPTMWWGYPHLPNSGIVKQVIKDGFRYKGRIHDCLRIHWHRPDGVKDGMAYGVYPSWVVGDNTVTFYYRSPDIRGVGSTISFSVYCNGYSVGAPVFTLSSEWQKFSYTFNSTQAAGCNFYWFQNSGAGRLCWEIAEITSNQTAVTTEMVSGTRSNTQTLLDLTGNNTLTATSLTYNSDGTFSFNGTSDGIKSSSTIFNKVNGEPISVCCWAKPLRNAGQYQHLVANRSDSTYNWILYQHTTDGSIQFHGSAQNKSSYIPATGVWIYIVATVDPSGNSLLYINGVVQQTVTGYTYGGGAPGELWVGRYGNSNYEQFQGSIPIVQVYNKTLTAAEIKQNFSASRGRYGV